MELCLTTWNCFGQGQGWDAIRALRAPARRRLDDAAVVARCAAVDVLCVQEILSRDAEGFFDRLTHPSRFRDHNRAHWWGRTLRGSGLGIGSRFTLCETHVRSFPVGAVGWDRLARKGALYAQLALADGLVVDVLNVHLQAGRDEGAVRVRGRQLGVLARWIAELGAPERPFVVCGDFNVDGLHAARASQDYRQLAAALAGFVDLGAEEDLPTFHAHPDGNTLAHRYEPNSTTMRLDYVFFRPARADRLAPLRLDLVFHEPLCPQKRTFASDHFGVTATFQY